MLIKNWIFFAFLGASSAFIIPDGTEDGVYEHHVDANGLDVHIKIADATDYSDSHLSAKTEVPDSVRSLHRRSEGVKCGASANMNRGVSPRDPANKAPH